MAEANIHIVSELVLYLFLAKESLLQNEKNEIKIPFDKLYNDLYEKEFDLVESS